MHSNLRTDTFVATLLFAMIFIFGWRLHRARTPRAVLSLGAGATASYVFVRMLPELGEAQTVFVAESAGRSLPAPAFRVYTAALLGFIVFYGLENLVTWSREGPEPEGSCRDWSSPVFLLHVGGFALYAWLITYLMMRGISDTPLPIALYAIAMGLHFIGVDHSLLREHGAAYMRVGRFVLAAAALAGWSVATMTEISRAAIITSLGLISGGVVMNSMVMELPTEKDGRFWPFVTGAAAYTALLLLIR
jgi:ABC-type amino acid transport system permease subunit